MSRMRAGLTLASALLALAAPPVAGSALAAACEPDVVTSGALRADCSGDLALDGGRFDLAGHRLSGRIRCLADRCEIVSQPPRGVIDGHGTPHRAGIDAPSSSLVLDGVVVTGFGTGVTAAAVWASDVAITGNASFGIQTLGRIELTDSVIELNGGDGLHSQIGAVAVDSSQIVANGGHGIHALKGVSIRDSNVQANGGDGIRNFSGTLSVLDSSVVDNGGNGVRTDDSDCTPTGTLELVGSEVANNAAATGCGDSEACADVAACHPSLVDSASRCGTSYRIGSGLPGSGWRICGGD